MIALVGATLLVLSCAPGCSSEGRPAQSFSLPAPAFPAIVELAKEDPDKALAALEAQRGADVTLEANVLRAHLLGTAGRHVESAQVWRDVGAAEPALDVYARRAAVSAHVAAGNAGAAHELLQPLMTGATPTNHTDVALDVATALRVAGRHDEARALYQTVLASRDTGSRAEHARLGLAESYASGGDIDAALAETRRVRLTFGNFESYDAATRAEKRIAEAAARPVPAISPADYDTMIGRLLARSRYAEAIGLYEEQLKIEDGAGAARIEAAVIDALYRARENSKARSRIRAFRKQWPGSTYDDELAVLDFRIAIREARTADVRRLGYAIMRGRVAGVPQSEARGIGRLVGSYLVAVGRIREGLAVFREMFQSSDSRDEQADLLWRAGIAALRAGDLDRAESNLQGLIDRRVGPDTTRIARFWLADIEARRGNKTNAREIWTSLADEQPLEYYGLRAADRLGRTDRLSSSLPAPDLTMLDETLASLNCARRACWPPRVCPPMRPRSCARPPNGFRPISASPTKPRARAWPRATTAPRTA